MTDKLIISSGQDADQYYATGLQLEDFITLVRGKKIVLAAGGFEYPQAAAAFPTTRFEDLGKNMNEIIAAFCKKYKVNNPVMPDNTKAKFVKAVPGATLSANIFPQRALKRKDEIKKIKETQKATEEAIKAVRETLTKAAVRNGKAYFKGKPLTSEYLKAIAAVALANNNCSCPNMIISSGKQSALPHHFGSGCIKEGAVVVDIFPQHNETRYFADCTRTFVVGKTPRAFEARYNALLDVHKQVRKSIKHGAANVDAISRTVLEEHGFKSDFKKGTGYIHGLGHGVGLEIHEAPRLKETLKAGNVITIEPGLYYDYGIRIEDMGLVTKSGFENFTKIDKNPYLN